MATPIDFNAAKEQYAYLGARGIKPEAMKILGLQIVASIEALEAAKLPVIHGVTRAILFPVYNIHGEETGLVGARYFYEKMGATFIDVPKPKFLTPKGAQMHFYFPKNIDWSRLQRGQRVFIAESYVKAIVMCSLGYHTVGISGCWGWGKNGKLHPGILDIGWQELDLQPVVFFDSNVHEDRPQLFAAARRLATRLAMETGVDARWLRLPPPSGDGDSDWGLDDFYMKEGEAALRALVEGELSALPSDIMMHVEALDDEVCYIENIGKVVRVDTGTLMSRDCFVSMAYANRLVWQDDREVSIPRRWLAWEGRKEVATMKYVPGGDRVVPGEYFNLWRGMGCAPAGGGDAGLWTQWLVDAIPDEGERVWFEQWLAWPLQNLGGKLTTFVFLTGESGVGKGWLAQILKQIYGLENCGVLLLQSLEDKFNSQYAAKQMVIVEECERIAGKGSRMYNKIKDLVTNTTIEYHPKGVTPTLIDNHINLLLEGNDLSALGKVDTFDRRLAAIEIRDQVGMANNADYWKPRWAWLQDGGAAAVYGHLLNLDLGGFDPQGEAPFTVAKRDIISMGLSDQEEWIEDLKRHPEEVLREYDGALFNAKELYWIMMDGAVSIHELSTEDYIGKVKSFAIALGKARVPKAHGGKKIKCPYTGKTAPYYQLRWLPVGTVGGFSKVLRLEWRDELYK